MKIKVKSEDFIVEETADIPLKKKGTFGVYILKKRGWNTVDLLMRLARELSIPYRLFSYGGKKDRYALTTQFITIKGGSHKIKCQTENYSLSFAGFTDRSMGPDLISGNDFDITVRDIKKAELQTVSKNLENTGRLGFPNYFDDQRFGSYDQKQGFIAERIMRGHFNGALQIYLTHIHPEDKKEEKERKRYFLENWKNWEACLQKAKTRFEKLAFDNLLKDPKGFAPLFQEIPREEMSLFFSAYQSYLWNEILRKVVGWIGKDLAVYKGVVDDYLFYNELNRDDFIYLNELNIPTPASKMKMPDKLTEMVYAEVLKGNVIKPSMFDIRKVIQAFFKSSARKAIIIPKGLSVSYSDDDIYKERRKLTLKFSLPRGSYGTMFIKRLFSK